MTLLRKLYRLTRLIGLLLNAVFKTLLYKNQVVDGIPAEAYFLRAQKLMHRMCRLLGLELVVEGDTPAERGLLVSNHISWLDIPVVGAVLPSLFLSKIEVKKWPLVGWIASNNGTLFIARGQQGAASKAMTDLSSALQQRVNVLLFPEGTTTDGTYLRNFHPRLYAAAIDSQRPIQPITIRYEDQDGSLNAAIPFVDGQSFVSNLWQVLGVKKIIVKVTILEPIAPGTKPRKELALQSREAVHKALQLTP